MLSWNQGFSRLKKCPERQKMVVITFSETDSFSWFLCCQHRHDETTFHRSSYTTRDLLLQYFICHLCELKKGCLHQFSGFESDSVKVCGDKTAQVFHMLFIIQMSKNKAQDLKHQFPNSVLVSLVLCCVPFLEGLFHQDTPVEHQ